MFEVTYFDLLILLAFTEKYGIFSQPALSIFLESPSYDVTVLPCSLIGQYFGGRSEQLFDSLQWLSPTNEKGALGNSSGEGVKSMLILLQQSELQGSNHYIQGKYRGQNATFWEKLGVKLPGGGGVL